ncbi:MAG TPA: hypothetical protein PLI95_00585 [Polyangiaceae bacterium]|nr:hypothetical protein [Polyangiaceae bacterium]
MNDARRAEGDDSTRAARREAPLRLVTSLYRIVKACQLHDELNQAVQELIGPFLEAVSGYCQAFGCETARVMFWRDVIFVNRRILRAPRETYEIVQQLSTILDHAGVNEVVIERTVTRNGASRFGHLVASSARDSGAALQLRQTGSHGISVRRTPGPDEDPSFEASDKPVTRLLQSYAASILIMQSFHAALAREERPAGHDVKRVAQKLVALAEEDAPLLVACALSPFPDDRRCRRAVSSAVVALAMARQLTSDRGALTTVAHAALLADMGRMRLDEHASDHDAACASVVAQAVMSQFQTHAVRRCVAGFEAMVTSPRLEAVYDGRTQPTAIASILAMARRFTDLRVPSPEVPRPKMSAVMDQLGQETDSPQALPVYRLLIAALGFYPPGTYVELDTGEVAIVTGIPLAPLEFSRPPVRVVAGANLQPLPKAVELDLARLPPGSPPRTIARPVMVKGMRDD